ncbi:hypothetical protein [Leptotrichia sp. oral taxon 223]|uniref:hypothetical protein n=1 Tax=Leptotrichia sp. oral taxon 223 TaxID=712363 RepID=UPI0015B97CA7|nr:hypothetical protein [Leptotrichia sp. oral taxon 223]NWO19371.1 hypothetical protein [Leptotrichia sp. oral taxon 223]
MKKILILSIIIFNLGIAKSLDNNLTKNITVSEIEQKNDRNLIMQEIESKRKKSLDELGEKIIDFYEMENSKNNYYTALYIFSKEAAMDFKYTIENVSYITKDKIEVTLNLTFLDEEENEKAFNEFGKIFVKEFGENRLESNRLFTNKEKDRVKEISKISISKIPKKNISKNITMVRKDNRWVSDIDFEDLIF